MAEMKVVLVVEDEVFTLEMARMTVMDLGYHVLAASSVEDALVVLRSTEPMSVLFTDIRLRKDIFGGCAVAREAVKLRPGLRVLYTTGNVASDELTAQFVAGAHLLRRSEAAGTSQTSRCRSMEAISREHARASMTAVDALS